MSRSVASLWLRIAPFDHHGNFFSRFLWSLLSEWDVMQAMMANSATIAHVGYFTVHRAWKMSELLPSSHSGGRYRPRVTTVVEAEPDTLEAVIAQLSHLTSLHLTIARRPKPKKRYEWTEHLPRSLTDLHLTMPSKVWRMLSDMTFPAALHELSIDDRLSGVEPTMLLCGALPPHVHTLNIRSGVWDWRSFQQLHLTPDSTQLRSLSVACASYNPSKVTASLLPHSLTHLALSEYAYTGPLSELQLPSLISLRLGQPDQIRNSYYDVITAESFVGMPVLRELHLRHAITFDKPLPVGALPATLTSLSLPYNYEPAIVPGALPVTLERLHIAHAVPLMPGTPGVNELRVGCLPAGLLSFVVERRRSGDYYTTNHPFTQPLSILPASLVQLRISNHGFNMELDALAGLPHLTSLVIDSHTFRQPLEPVSQIAQLRTLELSVDFPRPLPVLPAQLRHLTVRPASDVPYVHDHMWWNGTHRSGYTHELTAAQFALCVRLESVSLDAGAYDESSGTSVWSSWTEQQKKCPLFDSPIAAHVLPAMVQRLRLPQHYRFADEDDTLCVPEHCRVWKGAERVR